MGSTVALEAARQQNTGVQGVIFVDFLQEIDYHLDSTFVSNFNNRLAKQYRNIDEASKSFLGDSVVERRTYVARKWIDMMPSDEEMPTRWRYIAAGLFKWMSEDLKETLSEVDIPIRAINSDRKKTNLKEWNAFYPDFEEVVIPASHHMLIWQHHQKFNDALLAIISEIENK
jgi:pimeloyl-ACP methyl ester carboxylesterase